ncbi:MAG: hypothetical protein H8D92_02100 [Pelagibacteraceae bacterium]|jgi:GTP-sensing pleiotropic transcriptional regulator CodY|nr:hypothetical protein [Pelagibacteraceae bacterium]
MSRKNTIVITLKESDFELCKTFRERVYDALPKGEQTIASIVAKAMGSTRRVASNALDQLEHEGKLVSERGSVKFDGSTSRCRIFRKL